MSSVLIIGGGLAGLFTALKLAPMPCTVIAPCSLGLGASSAWAQGGIAAAISPGDSIDSHVSDTEIAGAGLVDSAVTRGMAREASDRIHDLLGYGVPFDKDLEGHLVASREAAHSHARIVRVGGDMAGARIMQALIAAVRKTPSIRVLEDALAQSLVVRDGRVCGARVTINGRPFLCHADHVVLATGGIGHLYAVTTNPVEARGHGLGMAAVAGAIIRDPEFVQFHPTGLDLGRDPAPLATEALRGEGAWLINRAGHRFMPDHHPDAELAPRDVVARGVYAEIQAGRGAFLDCRKAIGAHFPKAFPTVYAAAMAAGIDPVTAPLPVTPAQHYHMGGILTDADGHTSLPGLFAIGEVASTGVHGANRLASNSLLEAVVFGARVAAVLAASEGHSDVTLESLPAQTGAPPALKPFPAELRSDMLQHLGVLRETKGMCAALSRLKQLQADPGYTAESNALVAAELIMIGALLRQESRGGHYRTDFPMSATNPVHTVFTLAEARTHLPALLGGLDESPTIPTI